MAEQSFVFLSAGAAALEQTGGGALVQVTGGSSRRAMPGRGLWAAGRVRDPGARPSRRAGAACTGHPRGAARGRRDDRVAEDRGVHARPPAEALADMGGVAKAVAYLVEQGPRAVHARARRHAGRRALGSLAVCRRAPGLSGLPDPAADSDRDHGGEQRRQARERDGGPHRRGRSPRRRSPSRRRAHRSAPPTPT